MAKRKRLAPAQSEFLSQPAPLETKSGLISPAPISQVAADASATSALAELSQMVSDARSEGRLIQSIPLDDINASYLVRDRIVSDTDELDALIESIRDRGQQTAIEVVDLGATHRPRYGLISGWRRLSALRALSVQDDKFAKIQALIRSPETSSDAYIAMVEENEIRVGLSFYERARIVVKAMDEGVYPDTKTALQSLYKNVPRAKRSKIKSFMSIVETLDGVLRFPSDIGERLGLEVARYCSEIGSSGLVDALHNANPETASQEQDVLRSVLSPKTPRAPKPAAPKTTNFDPKSGQITISGADKDLYRALKKWLSTRET